jgi:NAD(P)-dependent dehydrogenase (short-subunit alcohol dehydrogenase family)
MAIPRIVAEMRMSSFLVTGAASGIGEAVCHRLKRGGHRVLRVDLRDGDIVADLGAPEGRATMIVEAERLVPGGLDGVVAAAGISAPARPRETIAINYFGAVATLEGLRPLLARRPHPRAVAIGSTSALLKTDIATVEACLAGDEATATAEIAARPETAYMTSKLALTRWLRRAATTSDWGGAGILLNGVAPGVVETPMTAPLLLDPQMVALIGQTNPMSVQGFAKPDEIAELICFLLTLEGHYLLGQMIFIDGGTDAIMRPDSF